MSEHDTEQSGDIAGIVGKVVVFFAGGSLGVFLLTWMLQQEGRLSSLESGVKRAQEEVDSLEVPPPWFKAIVDENTRQVRDVERRLHRLEK